MKRTLLIAALCGVLALALRGTRLEDDPVRSLTHSDPVRAALFDHYQAQGLFKDKIFVEWDGLATGDRDRLAAALKGAGYQEIPLIERPPAAVVQALVPVLPADEVARLMSEDALRERAREAASVAALPGGDAILAELERDPLGLEPALFARLVGGGRDEGGGGGVVHTFRSPVPLEYDRIGPVYDLLVSLGSRVHFIGADFFALENYRAAIHDIFLCSTLTLLLNLAVFWVFTRRWMLLGLLFFGSMVSYLTGLLAIRAVYAQVFAVVLAYTSTFVSFDNESLVHLSGLDGEERDRSLLGVWSAVGTTVIGFLVLLLGRSVMVRQMALASLGGMAGFLLFLWPYRAELRTVRFRTFAWPKWTLRRRTVVALCAVSVAGVLVVGVPPLATHIDGFRFQTPALDAQVEHFSRKLDAFALDDVLAVPAPAGPEAALAPLVAARRVDLSRHPLSRLPPRAEQERTLRALEGYPEAVGRLGGYLEEAGIRLAFAPRLPDGLAPLDGWAYLERLGAVSPVRWTDTVDGQRFVMAGQVPGGSDAELGGAVPVSPRHHYDALLTGVSRELGWLFLAGLAVMAVYLVLLQRSAARVAYVFAPLFLSALAFAVYARLTGATVHVVHIMGFSLIIGLALDYTSVVVSGEHGAVELSKVLLTGLSTLATFGILVLARHPVLRELGVTVALGCGVSLAFALFFRLAPGGGRAP